MYHLGLVYFKMGRYPEARQELDQALNGQNFAEAADARQLLGSMPN